MYDVILVMGHSLDKEGNPSREQILRINTGIKLLKENKAKYIIMSGGFGEHFNQTKRSLAVHMKKFAVDKGISPSKIFTENKSYDTADNLILSKRIIQRHRWKSVIIVSSRYHVPRIKMICGYVFAKGFKLRFVGVDTENDNNEQILKDEKRYAQEDKKWLKTHKI